jgi:hypothetical protein
MGSIARRKWGGSGVYQWQQILRLKQRYLRSSELHPINFCTEGTPGFTWPYHARSLSEVLRQRKLDEIGRLLPESEYAQLK